MFFPLCLPLCVTCEWPRAAPRWWSLRRRSEPAPPSPPGVGTLTFSMRAWVLTDVLSTEQEVRHSELRVLCCAGSLRIKHIRVPGAALLLQRPRGPYVPTWAFFSGRASLTCSVESEHSNFGRKFQGNPPFFRPLRNWRYFISFLENFHN